MVVTTRLEPTVVVPDDTTWTMAGCDPAGLGLVPTASAESARVLLAPLEVPYPLVEALLGEWRRAPNQLDLHCDGAVVLSGRPLAELLDGDRSSRSNNVDEEARDGHSGQNGDHADGTQREPRHGADAGNESNEEQTAGHEEHNGHEDHDMMAIVGDPSSDGLVMETIDFSFGPLSAALPGGLVLDLTLDGDEVAACMVRPTLTAGVDGPTASPDPLTPAAWAVARLVATEVAAGRFPTARVQWERIATVELERALSHLAWLRSLGRILGWAQLVDAAQRGVTAIASLRHDAGDRLWPDAVRAAGAILDPVAHLVAGRRLASRARGRGHADNETLVGPNVRASGQSRDTRQDDPLYAYLGFKAVGERAGDAWARARVRMAEVQQSLGLAAGSLERARTATGAGVPEAFATATGARVEGPRGPVLVSRSAPDADPQHAAPGAAATLRIAGSAVVGLEWSAALVTLASFDLSPWTVRA